MTSEPTYVLRIEERHRDDGVTEIVCELMLEDRLVHVFRALPEYAEKYDLKSSVLSSARLPPHTRVDVQVKPS